MEFYRTSRKDDIISLFYLLVHLLNDGEFVCKMEDLYLVKGLKSKYLDSNEKFKILRYYKK